MPVLSSARDEHLHDEVLCNQCVEEADEPQEEPFAVLTPDGEIYARCWTIEDADSMANALEEQAGVEIGSMYLVVSTRATDLEAYTDRKSAERSTLRNAIARAITRALVQDDRSDGETLDEMFSDLCAALPAKLDDFRKKITHEKGNPEAWHCECGNEPHRDGFYPCNEKGELVEPTPGEWTSGLYRCERCRFVFHPNSVVRR
ncbi:MAG: hypothetical protein JNK76_24430 [Planctomycetales bacterium]|nr:hypothetical protein [Planctomycetales bacterium]